MEPLVAKILIMFGLLFSTILAALLPLLCLKFTTKHKLKMKQCCNCFSNYQSQESKAIVRNESVATTVSQSRRKKSRKKMIISILNCFAGGIFLGTSFIALLPEIREKFETFDIRWPVLHHSDNKMVNGSAGNEANEQAPMPVAEIVVVGGLFFILCVEQATHAWNRYRQKKKAIGLQESQMELRLRELGHESQQRNLAWGNESGPSLEADEETKPDHDHSAIRSLILVATLSLHSLLEGTAIGLQDGIQNAVAIAVAVLFHKCLMAFSMGTNLVHANQAIKKVVAAACIFAFASPIGIAIGLIVKSGGGDDSGTTLVNSILQAVATGTFLYITFFEVLVKEFESHENRLAKVVSLFVGYFTVLGTSFANNG